MRAFRPSAFVFAALAALALLACSGGGGTNPTATDAAGDGRAPPPDGPAVDAPGGTIDAAPLVDPASPGPFRALPTTTVTITLSPGATVAGSVTGPSVDGTTPAPGRFPLVVVSSGYQLARAQYDYLCQHLATWGYVCITHDYRASGNHQAKAAEVVSTISWALGASSNLAGRIQADQIAVAGHSLGGKVSINAVVLDPRIKAVVGWDPVDALPPFGNDGSTSVTPELMNQVRVPMAVLGETTDAGGGGGFGQACAPSADNYQKFFEAACQAPRALEVTIAGADHMDWIGDRASCGLACLACRSGTASEDAVRTITRRVTTAWFERHLRGRVEADGWLTAGTVGAGTSIRTNPGC